MEQNRIDIGGLFTYALMWLVIAFCLTVYRDIRNGQLEKTEKLIYAGNVEGDLIEYAVKFHGEGNAHYSDSLGYWYFIREGQKLRLMNENVLKRWRDK